MKELDAEQMREILHRAEYAARVQESVGNEGDADAIRRDAIRTALGLEIGDALPPPKSDRTDEDQ
jgi:hypothetical protein